jgi:DNA-binding XRE family transcriptional regulator
MRTARQKRLEARGWKFGNTSDFLGLSPQEATLVEMKLALSQALKKLRKGRRLTQEQLAQILESSQSRVAKMEAADPSVSLDLLVHSLLELGVSREALARMLLSS